MTDQPSSAASPESHWLAHVPVPLFAVVMGVAGLGLVWRKAHEVGAVPKLAGEAITAFGALCFIAIALLYLRKVLRHPEAVRGEFEHPVRANFFAAISISMLLIAVGALPYASGVALALWGLGALVQFGLTLHLVARWIGRPFEIHHSNPAWFIPVVGNILVPIAGVRLGFPEVSWFFFSIGMVFWVVLFTIVFYRIVFHGQLPPKLVPMLFIFIPPPAIGFLAYLQVSGGELDAFARVLFYFSLFLVFLMASMWRTFVKAPFAVSWWAFTFPLDAAALATLQFGQASGLPLIQGLGMVLLTAATLVVAMVFVRTLAALRAGALFVPE